MGEMVQNMSSELAAIVEQAGRWAVRVEGRRRMPATGIGWAREGVIATASHVIERDEELFVGLSSGERLAAQLIGRDPGTDLAALQVDGVELAAAERAGGAGLEVGHLVLALGRPGKTVQATLGIVSAVGEAWRTPAGGQVDQYLQTDVVMYPGFSGGPLVDMQGMVRGLNTSAMGGVSLALPVSTIQQVVESLQTHGRVRRGYLGVGLQPARLPRGVAEEQAQETGLLILSVEPDSPAEQGGLTLGDTLLSLDGQPIRHMDDLMALLAGDRVGKKVSLQVLRGGRLEKLSVTVGERPSG
jgi:S1-C subfamily serine protease